MGRRLGGRSRWIAWARPLPAVVVSLLVFRPVGAQVCPRAELSGSDPTLVAEVRRHLLALPLTSTASTAGCRPVVIEIGRMGEGVQLTMRKGPAEVVRRVVKSPQTAASLVASWMSEPLSDLFWPELPAPPKASSLPFETSTPIQTGLAEPAAPPLGRLWVAAMGVTADGGARGAGLDFAWETGNGWRIGPTLRLHVDEIASEEERAGARAFEGAFGLHGGYAWSLGASTVGLRLGVLAAYRFIDPDGPVGPIFCAPIDPCGLGESAPPDASSYHVLTAWPEADLAWSVGLSEHLGIGARFSFAATPGFFEVNPPPIGPPRGEDDRIRVLPVLPKWRALIRLGVWWPGQ